MRLIRQSHEGGRGISPRRRLQVELLEPRVSLTCSVGLQPSNTLIIADVGKPTDNNVVITDNGTQIVAVDCDGGISGPFAPNIDTILVSTARGNDAVTYVFGSLAINSTRNIEISLGPGRDSFEIRHINQLDIMHTLVISVSGGPGADLFSVAGELHVGLAGYFELEMDGDKGRDEVLGVGFQITRILQSPPGSFRIRVAGSGSSDILTLGVSNQDHLPGIALLDGGEGIADICNSRSLIIGQAEVEGIEVKIECELPAENSMV